MDNSAQNTTGPAVAAQTEIVQPSSIPQAVPAVSKDEQEDVATAQLKRLAAKVESTELPPDLKLTLVERVKRLELIRSSAGFLSPTYVVEYDNANSYINWVVGLPWNLTSQDKLDLNAAAQILNKNHYGLQPVKEKILDFMAAIILNAKKPLNERNLHAPVLCLVGLAGTGKTTLASSIAEALGRSFARIPFGGMGSAQVLRGQSRAFTDAEPGYVVKKLVAAKTKNPVILLDELDRVSGEARADIMGVLVELLDPGQNKAFSDHYIDYPFDLTQVLFVATVNNTTNIATAVMDRLELIQMPSYTDEEKIVIAKTHLFPKIFKDTGLSQGQFSVNEDVWPNIIRPLGYDSGIRSLDRCIGDICRKVARMIVEGKAASVTLTNENLRIFMPA
jgi:ATP-dependent Lon protease